MIKKQTANAAPRPPSSAFATVTLRYMQLDAYIDPEERFCIVIGCGIIKYNLEKPFDEYSYDTVTPQWIETGRTDEIEWCDKIEEVTESYVTVSLGGADKRIFDLKTLAKK